MTRTFKAIVIACALAGLGTLLAGCHASGGVSTYPTTDYVIVE